MNSHKEMLIAKDDSGLWALVEELKARRAARGIKEPEGPPEFVKKFRKRLAERKAQQMQRQAFPHTFLALFEPMDSNGYRAVCPTIENCTVEAPTREEAKAALIGEIKHRLRAKLQAGETLPTERGSAEMVEVVLGEE
jgi:hypothetical protein